MVPAGRTAGLNRRRAAGLTQRRTAGITGEGGMKVTERPYRAGAGDSRGRRGRIWWAAEVPGEASGADGGLGPGTGRGGRSRTCGVHGRNGQSWGCTSASRRLRGLRRVWAHGRCC